MRIAISGGSGFLGQQLSQVFSSNGHDVIILTRQAAAQVGRIKYVQWLHPHNDPTSELEDLDAFINLAGTSLNSGRWTENRKEEIFASRMQTTNELLTIFKKLHRKPKVFINASAVGIYPISKAATYNEYSMQQATDFLGKTVASWEKLARKAEEFGIRTVITRFGVILGRGGEALNLMVLPYKLHIGGNLGSGTQWLSWVHIDDAVGAIQHILWREQIAGIVNITSPFPVRMDQFGQTIAAVLNRRHWFPVPAPLLKIALGERSIMVLEGQRVIPQVLLDQGYDFQFPKVQDALTNLL